MINVRSTYWQISALGVGIIAEGIEDIRQCIDLILRTRKGTAPLNPLFGSDVYEWVDKPVTLSIPNIKKAIIDAIGIWEKRVEVQKITHEINVSHLVFHITYKLVDQDLLDIISLYLGGGFVNALPGDTGYVILTAFIPQNVPPNKTYNINFACSGTLVPPSPPPAGFATVDELYAWANENWIAYGHWYKTGDRMILYMKKGMCSSPSLSITVGAFYTFSDDFIAPDPGGFYAITFLPNNQAPPILFPEDLFVTKEEVLFWVQENWADYGSWSIEGNALVLITDKFSDCVLVLHTSELPLLYFDDDVVMFDGNYVLIKD